MRRFILIILIAFAAAACSSSEPEIPTAAPTPELVRLSEPLVSSDGSVLLLYPDGWTAASEGGTILLASDEVLLSDNAPDGLESGEVVMVINITTRGESDLSAGLSLTEIAEVVINSLNNTGTLNSGDVQEFTLAGQPSASFTGTIRFEDSITGIYVLLMDRPQDNLFIDIFASTAPGEEIRLREIVNAIAASTEVRESGG